MSENTQNDAADLRAFVTKCIDDEAFRQLVQTDPAAALTQLGIPVTQARLNSINNISREEMQALAESFGHHTLTN